MLLTVRALVLANLSQTRLDVSRSEHHSKMLISAAEDPSDDQFAKAPSVVEGVQEPARSLSVVSNELGGIRVIIAKIPQGDLAQPILVGVFLLQFHELALPVFKRHSVSQKVPHLEHLCVHRIND